MQDSGQKPTLDEYRGWLQRALAIRLNQRTQRYYENVSTNLVRRVKSSPVWTELTTHWRDLEDRYRSVTRYPLFMQPSPPDLLAKPYTSTIEKSFRHNILNNPDFPSPPSSGWITPLNWYEHFPDIVRTTVVVKYLDAVPSLIRDLEEISTLCRQRGQVVNSSFSYEAREHGYYGAQFIVEQQLEIEEPDWDTRVIPFTFEIQITTQLQEIAYSLSHPYYEQRRLTRTDDNRLPWQWDYQSSEFVANYLGHVLHYLEGAIMNLREEAVRNV